MVTCVHQIFDLYEVKIRIDTCHARCKIHSTIDDAAAAGKKRKAANRNKGTTPKFAIHEK